MSNSAISRLLGAPAPKSIFFVALQLVWRKINHCAALFMTSSMKFSATLCSINGKKLYFAPEESLKNYVINSCRGKKPLSNNQVVVCSDKIYPDLYEFVGKTCNVVVSQKRYCFRSTFEKTRGQIIEGTNFQLLEIKAAFPEN